MSNINPHINGSLIAQPITATNFVAQLSAKITTSGTSSSVTFTPITGNYQANI